MCALLEQNLIHWSWLLLLKYINWTKVPSSQMEFQISEHERDFIHCFSLAELLPFIWIMDCRRLTWQSPGWDNQVGEQNKGQKGIRSCISPLPAVYINLSVLAQFALMAFPALGRRWALTNLYFSCIVKGMVECTSGLSALLKDQLLIVPIYC